MIAGARLARDVALVECQMILVEDLDQLPMPEPAAAPGAHARLRPDHSRTEDVITAMPVLPILAAAGLGAGGVGDVVAMLAVQARDGVEPAAVVSEWCQRSPGTMPGLPSLPLFCRTFRSAPGRI